MLEAERASIAFFEALPMNDRARVDFANVRGVQFLQPLFEFSGACGGCGETPYLKLLSQLFGDRLQIANATGCSSIYGGNLPVTPWTKDADGRGPAWSNSLFEDNAEFGLGFRLAADKHLELATTLLRRLAPSVGEDLARAILEAPQVRESELRAQRARVDALKQKLVTMDDEPARDLLSVVDQLVRRSIWIVGGDGWAYDIGYGGLDHVLATGRDVNLLVLDTEVYSNTGGQASKATPLGAVAKFASAGKRVARKDLALQAIAYGNVYVAQVAMGANPQQTLLAFREAETYPGPSLILAYSQCIAHGFDLRYGMKQQDLATASGYWPLFRFNPAMRTVGERPFRLDSPRPTHAVQGLRLQRAALSDACQHRSEGSGRAPGEGAAGRDGEVPAVRGVGEPRRRVLPSRLRPSPRQRRHARVTIVPEPRSTAMDAATSSGSLADLGHGDGSPGSPAIPIIQVRGVTKSYRMGDVTVDALRGVDLSLCRRGARCAARSVRQRQIHAAQHHRRARSADERADRSTGAGSRPAPARRRSPGTGASRWGSSSSSSTSCRR